VIGEDKRVGAVIGEEINKSVSFLEFSVAFSGFYVPYVPPDPGFAFMETQGRNKRLVSCF